MEHEQPEHKIQGQPEAIYHADRAGSHHRHVPDHDGRQAAKAHERLQHRFPERLCRHSCGGYAFMHPDGRQYRPVRRVGGCAGGRVRRHLHHQLGLEHLSDDRRLSGDWRFDRHVAGFLDRLCAYSGVHRDAVGHAGVSRAGAAGVKRTYPGALPG